MLFYKSVSELTSDMVLKTTQLPKLRQMTKILVIDDEEFTYLEALRRHGYCIEQKHDIESLYDVEAYDMILCDTRGVGKFLDSEYEGAYMVKQLKENYPKKVIISYTAYDYNSDYSRFLDYADDKMPKGVSIDDWTSKLDGKLKDSVDPIKQWIITRNALLDAGVSTIQVAKLESKYVKSITSGSFSSFEKLAKKENYAPIVALLGSFIVKLITKVI